MSITRLLYRSTADWIALADLPQEIIDECYRKCSRRDPILFCSHYHPVYLQRRPPSYSLCAVSMEDKHTHKDERQASEMSIEHRRERDYSSLVLEAAGIRAPREFILPSKAKPDVAVFASVPYGIEIQRAHVAPDTAVKRTCRAIAGGMTYSLWVNDGLKPAQPRWYGKVPSAKLNTWNWAEEMPRPRQVTVAAGPMEIKPKRCTPEFFPSCPKRNRRHCGGWHPWLTQWLDEEEQAGRFTYDDLLLNLAEGLVRPLRFNGKRIILTSQKSISTYEELIDRPAELLFNPKTEMRVVPDLRDRDDDHAHSQHSVWPRIITAEMCEQMALPFLLERPRLVIRPHYCTICGQPGAQYPDGWRCENHRRRSA